MPLNLFYTMVQKSEKWPKTQIKGGGGGPALSFVWKCAHQTLFEGVVNLSLYHRSSRYASLCGEEAKR